MIRNTAREIAVHLAYELSFTDKTPQQLLDERLTRDYFESLRDEDDIYEKAPGAAQEAYIRAIVTGVAEHAPELDGYIARYARGWSFERIPLVASAIMRVAMFEVLYRSDIPNSVAINEAVEIAKKYETPNKTARSKSRVPPAAALCFSSVGRRKARGGRAWNSSR